MFNFIIASTFSMASQYVCTAVLVMTVVLLSANIYATSKRPHKKRKVAKRERILLEPKSSFSLARFDDNDIRYNKSFTAKLILSELSVKSYYVELANYLLGYKGVKSRISWSNASFNRGRAKMTKFAIRGKTLYMYIALDPADYVDTKYYPKDMSDVKKYIDVPMRVKVKSPRGVKFAKELIDILATKMGLLRLENITPSVAIRDYKYESINSLIERGLIKVYGANAIDGDIEAEVACDVTYGGRMRPFNERLVEADDELQHRYIEVANYLLSYKNVHNRVSNAYSSFNRGRDQIAKLAIRGKTLYLYLALDPANYEGTKYYPTDASDVKKYSAVPMRVKVKSDRGVKYAKELVAELAGVYGIDQLDVPKLTVSMDDFNLAI